MMKKYWGKKEWSESLYLSPDFENERWFLDDSPYKYSHGQKFDFEKFMGFKDRNRFEDTNEFTVNSETFNCYQFGKI